MYDQLSVISQPDQQIFTPAIHRLNHRTVDITGRDELG